LFTLASASSLLAAEPPLLPFNDTGDLFVMDNQCECILRITPEREVSIHLTKQQIMSVTGATDVDFDFTGLAFDAEGAMYFSEEESLTILKQSASGVLTILVSRSSLLMAVGFSDIDINALAFGNDGLLYAVDYLTDSILAIDPQSGDVWVLVNAQDFQSVLNPDEELSLDAGLVADDKCSLYVSSGPTPGVFRVSTIDGTITRLASGSPFMAPWWYGTRAPNGDLIFCDSETILFRITEDGEVSTFLTGAQIQAITGRSVDLDSGLAFDASGDLYLGEFNSGHILRMSEQNGVAQGIEIWVSQAEILAVTGEDHTELEAQIAFAPAHKLHFAQFANGLGLFSQIHLIALSTTLTTTAEITLKTPEGGPLSVALNGNLVDGRLEDVMIAPSGSVVLSTDGQGTSFEGQRRSVRTSRWRV
jgi:hypothetical protein